MIIEEIAIDAVTSITTYLTQKISGKLAEKTEELYQKIKEKLSSNSYADQSLKRVEEEPTSKRRQVALEEVVVEEMNNDPKFAEEITQLMEELKKIPGSKNVVVYGERSVAVSGNMINSNVITGDGSTIGDRGLKKSD
jgi:ribosomal protein L5